MEFARHRATRSTDPASIRAAQPHLLRPRRLRVGWARQRASLCCAASTSQPGGGSEEPPLASPSSSTSLLQPEPATLASSSASSSLSSATSTGGSTSTTTSSQQGPDHFRLAGQRLQNLLAGVGDGEDEFVNNMIMEQTPEEKIALSAAAGGIITAAAFFISWLAGVDPLGGASLSLHSLRAAALGALAGLPLVGLKAYLWSEHCKREVSWIEDYHRAQVEGFKPLMHELSPAQTALFVVWEVVPGVLILLPAAMGGLERALQLGGDYLLSTGGAGAGTAVPALVAQTAALALTAGIAGLSKLAENSMSYQEYSIVKDALENADRYYKVMAMNRDAGVCEAQRAADAFRVVALTWMARSQLVSQLAAAVSVVEVIYLGVLWQETGDLAAPIVAALTASAVDFANIRRTLAGAGQQRRSAPPSP